MDFDEPDTAFCPMWDNENGMHDPLMHFHPARTIADAVEAAASHNALFNADHAADVTTGTDMDMFLLNTMEHLGNNAPGVVADTSDDDVSDVDDAPNTQQPDGVDAGTNTAPATNMSSCNMFKDGLHGTLTPLEEFSLELLNIMRNSGAPNYVYHQIVDTVECTLLRRNVKTIHPPFCHCKQAITHFAKRFDLHQLAPTQGLVHCQDRTYSVPLQDARLQTLSLLHDPRLMKPDQLVFGTIGGPQDPLPASPAICGNVHTRDAFQRGFRALKTRADILPVAFIPCIDKLTVDQHGHLSLEPVCFTLSLFPVQPATSLMPGGRWEAFPTFSCFLNLSRNTP